MSKELTPLKALEEIREDCDCGAFQRRCDIIEKALKALEIIKKKSVNVSALNNSSYIGEYNYQRVECRHLTKEEYELLKEELL